MDTLSVCVEYDDELVKERISCALRQCIPRLEFVSCAVAALQWSSYEHIAFERILAHPRTTLCNTYIFRKALIRKHFLANTVYNWVIKHPGSVLARTVPKTYLLECDYAEYLDEALNESFELREALDRNEGMDEEERTWFILKPSMADRGQGIRIFSSRHELEDIFTQFDDNSDDEKSDTGVIAGQLRHFVVQEYISRPLLLRSLRPAAKFHLRVYVVASGALKVYVWSEILALFAPKTFLPPGKSATELDRHLSNTCLQDEADKGYNVHRFWSLPLSPHELDVIYKSICDVTGEIFTAAAVGQQMHFQVPIPRT
jgi:tubulin---tyrosine ligase